MRKILSLLGVLTLSTTASASVIACNKKQEPKPTPVPPTPIQIKLNQQVAKDLKLIDNTNKSLATALITSTYHNQKHDWKWDVDHNVKNIKASDLLDISNRPKSKKSEHFLINNLKLVKNADGTFSQEIYDIIVLTSEIKPLFAKKQDNSDYEVVGGNFKLQFVNRKKFEKLGENYTVDLKTGNGLIANLIGFNLSENSFVNIPGFKIGKANTEPTNDTNIFQYLQKTSDKQYIIDKLNSLNNFINKGDLITIKVTGRDVNSTYQNWILGDKLFVKIYFGSICSSEYSLMVE